MFFQIEELSKVSAHFRVLALSATPGSNPRKIQTVNDFGVVAILIFLLFLRFFFLLSLLLLSLRLLWIFSIYVAVATCFTFYEAYQP